MLGEGTRGKDGFARGVPGRGAVMEIFPTKISPALLSMASNRISMNSTSCGIVLRTAEARNESPPIRGTRWLRRVIRRALLCGALLASFSPAEAAGRDMVKEAAIEAELGEIQPALVEPFRQARIAYDADDLPTVERLLRPVVDQAPRFDAAWRRLGSAIARQGRRDEGVKLVEHALEIRRTAANLASLAFVLARGATDDTQAPESDRRRALALLQEARTLPDGEAADILAVTAQMAFELREVSVAEEAVRRLEALHPKEMMTHYLAAILAATQEKWIRAEDEIIEARGLGLPAEAAQRFLDSGIHRVASQWRIARNVGATVAAWMLGLASLFGVGWGLSRLTLRQVERSDPRVPIAEGERRLRRVYRAVLNLAGLYYYVSLPVVLVLVVAVAVFVVLALLMIGYIPIYFLAVVVIGALATIWSMLRSFFIRVNTTEPGRMLSREEAGELWRVAEEVAATVQTRPVDEIRITPGTDLCVYERGSWRERMRNRGRRVLVLGAAVLDDFKLDDFRSVLAHEYGHFAHRDTAGGDVALRVRNDILKFYVAMVQAGQNTWLNVAFHFLRFYHFLFRRISHGATRLQEVLADRVAAQAYGPAAFQGGLTHVIRRSVLFHSNANREIDAAIKAGRPIPNLYDPLPAAGGSDEAEIEKALARPTTDDDTHPGPRDRFRLTSAIPEPRRSDGGDGTVWSLFNDREAIVREQLALVEKDLAPHRA